MIEGARAMRIGPELFFAKHAGAAKSINNATGAYFLKSYHSSTPVGKIGLRVFFRK